MNTRIVSAIVLKLFAIYVVVMAIIATPGIIGTYFTLRDSSMARDAGVLVPAVIVIATLAVAAVAARILWMLGNSVLINASELTPDTGPDIRSFERTLFVLLGVYFSVSAIVRIPQLASAFWVMHHTVTGMTVRDYAWAVSIAVQLLIGMSMVARLDKWVMFVRTLGTH